MRIGMRERPTARSPLSATARQLLSLLALLSPTTTVSGQANIAVKLSVPAINDGSSGTCTVAVIKPGGLEDKTQDVVRVQIFEDAKLAKSAKSPTQLLLFLEGEQKGSVAKDVEEQEIAVGVMGLRDRVVRIRRFDGTTDLCTITPLPRYSEAMMPDFTEFVADGAVTSALKAGAKATELTGSLGIHHRNTKESREQIPNWPRWLRWMPLRHAVDAEEFRALITLVGAKDTLVAPEPGASSAFASALLAPENASTGTFGSLYLEYHMMKRYGNGNQFRGPWGAVRFVRSTWTAKRERRTESDVDTLPFTENVSVALVDLRYRWMPIARVQDAKGNVFSVSLDAGWSLRRLDGDGARNDEFLDAALGTRRTTYTSVLGAVQIHLRQVTASAELPYFWRAGVKSLQGLQPLFRIRYEAPVFRL